MLPLVSVGMEPGYRHRAFFLFDVPHFSFDFDTDLWEHKQNMVPHFSNSSNEALFQAPYL